MNFDLLHYIFLLKKCNHFTAKSTEISINSFCNYYLYPVFSIPDFAKLQNSLRWSICSSADSNNKEKISISIFNLFSNFFIKNPSYFSKTFQFATLFGEQQKIRRRKNGNGLLIPYIKNTLYNILFIAMHFCSLCSFCSSTWFIWICWVADSVYWILLIEFIRVYGIFIEFMWVSVSFAATLWKLWNWKVQYCTKENFLIGKRLRN